MIAVGDGPAIDCPFELCHETVRLIIEQALPDDDEGTIKRVPLHDIANGSLPRGMCPASLLEIPLGDVAREHLDSAAAGFRALMEERWRTRSTDALDSQDAPEHSKTPHPKPGNGWFTQGGSPGPDPARPRLRFIAGDDRPDANAHVPEGKPTLVTDNARERLRALAMMTAEKADAATEAAAQMTEKVRELKALSVSVHTQLINADSLARLAVGDPSGVPVQAAAMVAEVAAGQAALRAAQNAIDQAQRLIASIIGHASKGAGSARSYAGTI